MSTLVVLGCSSPASQPDAGGGGDAGDGGVVCTGDSDGDGHCNELDNCPGVANPTQVDFDGDGIGWDCDPVESVRFTSNGNADTLPAGWINRDGTAAAAFVTEGNSVAVKWAAVAVSGAGSMISNPDSPDPAEKWLTGRYVTGPVVSDDGQILFSRNAGSGVGETFAVDVGSRTVAPRAAATMIDLVQDATGGAVLMQMQGASFTLVEPRGGTDLHTVATAPASQTFWLDGSAAYAYKRVASDPDVFVPTNTFGGPAEGLRMFHPGANALSALPVPAAVGSRASRPTNETYGNPTTYLRNLSAPWCVPNDAASVRVWQWPTSGLESVVLPVSSCYMFWRTIGNTQFFFSQGPDLDGDGQQGQSLVFRRAGGVHEIARDVSLIESRLDNIHGTDALFVIEAYNNFTNTIPGKVWAVLPDSSVQLLSSDLSGVHASVAGQVVHIVGRGTGAQDGQWVVRRWRPGMPIQSVVIDTSSADVDARVVTSAEGAAIVSFGDHVYVAPSGSFTFTRNFDLREVSGGVRGANTFIVTGIVPNSGAHGNAYAYDEAGGQPRFTPLGTMGDDPEFSMFETPAGPTEYFAFSSFGQGCMVGRIVRNGAGVPMLDALPCLGRAGKYTVVGVDRAGVPIVGDIDPIASPHDLYRVGAAGPKVLAATGRVIPIADTSHTPPLIVGWTTLDLSPDGQLCLDESPVRCWAVPSTATVLHTRLENAEGPGPARVNQLLYDRSGMTNRFTIVRTRN